MERESTQPEVSLHDELPPANDRLPDISNPPGENGLMDYWYAIRKRPGILIAFASVGLLAGVFRTLTERPTYGSYSSLEIQIRQSNILDMKAADMNVGISAAETLMTQIKVLQSRSMLNRAQQRLEGNEPPGFKYPASPAVLFLRKLKLMRTPTDSGWKRAVAETAGSVVIRNVGGTRIVEISSQSPDPRLAANFVNALVEEYVKTMVESRWNSSQLMTQWLTNQLGPLKSNLESSEARLQSYARTAGLVFTNDKNNVEEQRLSELQSELSKAEADRIAKQSSYEVATTSMADSVPQILDSDRIKEYESKIADLRRELADLQSVYAPAHYKVRRVQAQIEQLENTLKKEHTDILARIEHDYQAAERRQKLLLSAYTSQIQRQLQQADKQMNYAILQREVELNRDLYQNVLQRMKEVDITSAIKASDIRVVDPAKPGGYRANYRSNASIGLMTGLLFGAILIIVRDRSDASLRSPAEVRSCLCAPELGVIPTAALPSKRRMIGDENGDGPFVPMELALWQSRPTAVAESFRTTLASVLFSGTNSSGPGVYVITSPGPREGKTAVVSNLGIAIAEIGRRVLLIDADMRKPRLHQIFDLANSWGLSDLLREKMSLDTYPMEALFRETRIPNLYLLPSGPGTASISNLLYSSRLPELLSCFRREFDIVLIDTPPMLWVPDARVIAKLADTVILVVRSGETHRATAISARQRLAEDGTPLLGTILNACNPEVGGYEYYRSS